MSEFYSVAIDGPSGAGKSTLAKRAAEALSFLYVDTGAIYRSIGWFISSREISPDDAKAVADELKELKLEIVYGDDGLQHMIVNGCDVTGEIRLPEMSAYASAVAAIPAVRDYLLDMQRNLAKTRNVIMDGRDIGTVVLPDAAVKVFLTASSETRAKRRCDELLQRGTPQPYDEVLAAMKIRDEKDRNRAVAPLKKAESAVELDTSAMSFDESLEALLRIIKEKINNES